MTELRAGIVVGPGSAAFEVMRDMVYNLPVLTPPRWVRSKSSPVALENLLVYLADLLAHPAQEHRIFDVAGPEYLSYQDMFKRFIALSGKRRWLIPIPLPTRLISVWFISLITSVPTPIARALIRGLKHDLPADGRPLQALIPQRLHTFDQAVATTLQREQEVVDSADWGYDPAARAAGAPATVTIRNRPVVRWTPPPPARPCGKRCSSWGRRRLFLRQYSVAHPRPHGRHDRQRVIYGRPARATTALGDEIDGWKVITLKPLRQLALLFGMKAPGLGRLSFSITDHGDRRTLDVRARWHPAGFSGLLYWFAMMPAHLFIFRGMAKRIAELAESTDRQQR